MNIGIKCGKFTFLHKGHFECLKNCAAMCDRLIVLVHDCGGDSNKFMSAEDRAEIIRAFRFVDEVHVYKEDTEDEWLQLHENDLRCYMPFGKPNSITLFHSVEMVGEKNLPGQKYVDRIAFVTRYGESVSDIIDRIRGEDNG